RDRVGEQLVKTVVDALQLESLVQVTSRREQQLRLFCPPFSAHFSFIIPPRSNGLSARLEGRLVTLEPLGPEHEEGLRAAGDDERNWPWMLTRDADAWSADHPRP